VKTTNAAWLITRHRSLQNIAGLIRKEYEILVSAGVDDLITKPGACPGMVKADELCERMEGER